MANRFFTQLAKEGKLKLVEPSEEIKDSYLEKSESNLSSSRILLENDKLEESITLTYYSMYNAVISLFFKIGLKCENHSASIILLSEVLGIDNSVISFAKEERIDKQYYADFIITKQEVEEAVESAENFNFIIKEFIARINNENISKYRNKLKELIT